MALTVANVFTRVQRIFGDEAGVQVVEADIINWINDALKEISRENDALMETTSTANIIQGQDKYAFPVDLNILRSLKYKGFRVKYMSKTEFDEYLDGYSAAINVSPYGPGVPEVFMVWNSVITLFPKPNENITGGLTIEYIRLPLSVVTSADPIDLPDVYFTTIVDYCLAQAYELDEDFEKKNVKLEEFQAKMMKLNNRNKSVQEYYPRITVLPEDENYGTYGYWGGFY